MVLVMSSAIHSTWALANADPRWTTSNADSATAKFLSLQIGLLTMDIPLVFSCKPKNTLVPCYSG